MRFKFFDNKTYKVFPRFRCLKYVPPPIYLEKVGRNIIVVAEHEREGRDILIKVNAPGGNSILDFSGARDYMVLGYDNNGALKYSHYAKNHAGSFIIMTPYKLIRLVLLPPTLNEQK